MEKTLDVLADNFGAVRAGRANAKVLDRITVEYYGQETPLNGVATISSPDARTLVIQPWDTHLLKDIQKEFGTTMIYITHDQEEAFAMSDRIMVMDKAEIVQIDTPEIIVNEPANDYVRDFVVNNIQIKVDSLVKYVRG
jgi:ABC-type histidine transport system ATPase subunit